MLKNPNQIKTQQTKQNKAKHFKHTDHQNKCALESDLVSLKEPFLVKKVSISLFQVYQTWFSLLQAGKILMASEILSLFLFIDPIYLSFRYHFVYLKASQATMA